VEVRTDLYKFLANRNMPITDDGCFMAYKGVDNNFFSKTLAQSSSVNKFIKGVVNDKGAVRNAVGDVIEVQKQEGYSIRQECSGYGIHVGSHNYASGYASGGRLLIVKVNPKDVVGIPTYENGKIRVSKYEVIAEEGQPLDEVEDRDFDKVKVAAYHNKRDENGRFVKS
jgi:hypothetical protein